MQNSSESIREIFKNLTDEKMQFLKEIKAPANLPFSSKKTNVHFPISIIQKQTPEKPSHLFQNNEIITKKIKNKQDQDEKLIQSKLARKDSFEYLSFLKDDEKQEKVKKVRKTRVIKHRTTKPPQQEKLFRKKNFINEKRNTSSEKRNTSSENSNANSLSEKSSSDKSSPDLMLLDSLSNVKLNLDDTKLNLNDTKLNLNDIKFNLDDPKINLNDPRLDLDVKPMELTPLHETRLNKIKLDSMLFKMEDLYVTRIPNNIIEPQFPTKLFEEKIEKKIESFHIFCGTPRNFWTRCKFFQELFHEVIEPCISKFGNFISYSNKPNNILNNIMNNQFSKEKIIQLAAANRFIHEDTEIELNNQCFLCGEFHKFVHYKITILEKDGSCQDIKYTDKKCGKKLESVCMLFRILNAIQLVPYEMKYMNNILLCINFYSKICQEVSQQE